MKLGQTRTSVAGLPEARLNEAVYGGRFRVLGVSSSAMEAIRWGHGWTDGGITVDVSQITPVQAAALADLRIDEYVSDKGRIRRTRLRLASKTRALELLGKHLKLWTDRVEARGDSPLRLAELLQKGRERVLRGMSDEELHNKIKQLQAELESRTPNFNIQFVKT